MPEGIWAAVFVALWVILLAQSAMLVLLSRQMRRLYLEHDYGSDTATVGLALGAQVPETEVTGIAGERIRLGGATGWKRLLVFLTPGCPACRIAIRDLQHVSTGDAQILLLWRASREKARDLAEDYQIQLPMVVDEEGQLWKEWMITGVPFAMVVDEQGRVAAKAFASQAEQFEGLLARAATSELVTISDAAPERAPAGAK